LKIAIAYHRVRGEGSRQRLIGRERGYHGVGFGGISVGGIAPNRKFFGSLIPGVDHLPHTHNLEHNAFTRGQPQWGAHLADELERIVTLHDASTIAAVIVEPVAGSTGVLIPPVGYLERLRTICDKYGILLIFDEVITGFGRLGASFATEYFGVIPDMVAVAKGITNATIPWGQCLPVKGFTTPSWRLPQKMRSNYSMATPILVILSPVLRQWQRWMFMKRKGCLPMPIISLATGKSAFIPYGVCPMSLIYATWGLWQRLS
jgi:4-aminobutyrate aminotransferase-like enzyme